MAEHELKCWPPFFEDVVTGRKTFEVRKDDRGFRVGDTLRLREWCEEHAAPVDRVPGAYTGREVRVKVTAAVDDSFPGIRRGYVVLGIEPLNAPAPDEGRLAEALLTARGLLLSLATHPALGAENEPPRTSCKAVADDLEAAYSRLRAPVSLERAAEAVAMCIVRAGLADASTEKPVAKASRDAARAVLAAAGVKVEEGGRDA